MKLKYITATCLVLLLISSGIDAGELSAYGRGRFASDEISIEAVFSADDDVTISAAASLSGKIYIIDEDIDRAIFKYRKILKTNDRSTAVDFAEMIEAKIQKLPSGLKLILRAPNPAPWSGRSESAQIEGKLVLPYNCRLDIRAEYFDFQVSGPFHVLKN